MGIGSWWKRFRQREDEATIERAEEEAHETLDERRVTSGDVQGLEADEFSARSMHEPKIEDAERLGEADEER
jgi:hypothetical protein